jgi:hypothetical protein
MGEKLAKWYLDSARLNQFNTGVAGVRRVAAVYASWKAPHTAGCGRTCSAALRWATGVRLGLGSALLCAAVANSFPTDEFIHFINDKPTVERMVFRVRSRKYQIPEASEDTFRMFTLTFDPHGAVQLVEDGTSYLTNAKVRFWGRFGEHYWRYFNSNDVITTEVAAPREYNKSTSDPYPTIVSYFGIGLDLLNLGVFDLDNGTVTWSGTTFSAMSKVGSRIHGSLLLDPTGQPSEMQMNYSLGDKTYPYRATYRFDRRMDLPECFPSAVKIESVGRPAPELISEYEVVEASFSKRTLQSRDVGYAGMLASNSAHFIFSNDNVYIQRRPGSADAKLVSVTNAPYAGRRRGRIAVAMLIVFLSVGTFVLIRRLQLKES